jgi:hypothetical protein
VRVAPMKAMKLVDDGSTGAAEMSTFHQLSGGNSGKGPGSVPPSMLMAAATAVNTHAGNSVHNPYLPAVDVGEGILEPKQAIRHGIVPSSQNRRYALLTFLSRLFQACRHDLACQTHRMSEPFRPVSRVHPSVIFESAVDDEEAR